MNVVAVIPCFNVQKFCLSVALRTLPYVDKLIVFDDGSTDDTHRLLLQCAQEHPKKVHLCSFKENQGKGKALIAAFEYALATFDFDALITLDGDNQHNPQDIPKLLHAFSDHQADLVIGGRNFQKMPFRSKFANTIISRCLRWIYPNAPIDTQSGMRLLSKRFAQETVQYVPGGRYETEFRSLLLALSLKRTICNVTIPTTYIDHNRSSHFKIFIDSAYILWAFLTHCVQRPWRFKDRANHLSSTNQKAWELKSPEELESP